MSQLLYRGSVKDLKGPVRARAGAEQVNAVVFEYTDAYSVFDWGKMPDPLARKGEALAVLAADWFEKLERAETWKEFSRSRRGRLACARATALARHSTRWAKTLQIRAGCARIISEPFPA